MLLYPRFHTLVKEDLDSANITVEELVVPQGRRAKIVQMALIDLVEGCLRELAKTLPGYGGDQEDRTELSFEAVLGKEFEAAIRRHLEPAWHQVGFKTRQLVAEIRTLRSLVKCYPASHLCCEML